MRSVYFCFAALAMTAPAYTQTTLPEAPSVTAGAEFKGLRFDWEPVPGAASYQLEYRAHQTGPFVVQHTVPASATSIRYRLPLHLFDWTYARYRLAACNSAGCARSAAISVSNLRRDAVGYFKAAPSLIGMRFGADTDISPNGLNFVAAAPGDFIQDASGNPRAGGAIYVFRRASDGTWTQRARLTPTIPPFIEGTNVMNVGISADGNTVVLGMPNYFHSQFDEDSGEVFVFRFNGATWTRTRVLSGARGQYGRWVSINDAGDTIATPYGEQIFSERPHRVAIYKLIDGTWQGVRGITDPAGHREFCDRGAMSRDGSTVAESCVEQVPGTTQIRFYVRTHSGPNWTARADMELELDASSGQGNVLGGIGLSATGDTIAAQIRVDHEPREDMGPSEVQVFRRVSGVYSKVTSLTPGSWRVDGQKNFYGLSVAVSGDGGTIAVGDSWDNGFGTGPRAAPLNPDPTRRSGAIYVYRLKTHWVLANMVKPNVAVASPSTFGHEVALNGNGQTLIVGHSAEGSDADGIGGDWNNYNGNGADSGAVFLY